MNEYVFYLRSGKVVPVSGEECVCIDNVRQVFVVRDREDRHTLTKRVVARITDPDMVLYPIEKTADDE